MSHSDILLHQALELPIDQRARMAHALLASLEANEEVEDAWDREILRRRKDILAGKASTITSEALFRSLGA